MGQSIIEFFYTPYSIYSEDLPNFADAKTYTDNFIVLAPQNKYKGRISFTSFDEATTRILNNQLLGGILDRTANHVRVTDSVGNMTYWWITKYTFNQTPISACDIELKLDYWLTYWPLQLKINSIVYVERRHCNRFYLKNNEIVPTWNSVLGNQDALQYLSNEADLIKSELMTGYHLLAPDLSNYQWVTVFNYAFGNIGETAQSGKIDDAGGQPSGIFYALNTPPLTMPETIITNPTFSMLYNNLSAQPVCNYFNYFDGGLITEPSLYTPNQLSPQVTYASPYLISAFNVLFPNPINIGVYFRDVDAEPISPSILCVCMTRSNGPGEILQPNSWFTYDKTTSNKSGYMMDLMEVMFKGSTNYSRPWFWGEDNKPTLPSDFGNDNGLAKYPFLFPTIELNRYFNDNPLLLNYQLPTGVNIIITPATKQTPLNYLYETKLMRLAQQFSIYSLFDKTPVNYFFDKINLSNIQNNQIVFKYRYVFSEQNANLIIEPLAYYDNQINFYLLTNYQKLIYSTVLADYNQIYTLNSPMYNFLNQHKSVYNTSVKQAEMMIKQQKYAYRGAIARASNPLSMGWSLAMGGQDPVTSLLSQKYAYYGAEFNKQRIQAQAEDASRQPDNINTGLFNDSQLNFWSNIQGKRLNLIWERFNEAELTKINLYFHKFGYEVNNNQIVTTDFFNNSDIKFGTRYYFNYWKIDSFYTAMNNDGASYNNSIINYFTNLFKNGMRLWNINNIGVKFRDYTNENWEQNIYNKLT